MTSRPVVNDLQLQALAIIDTMRAGVASGGQHWCHALLQAVRLWPLPAERVGDRTYRYLVGGEAFDWLLLAERLCGELDGLAPADEVEELLFHGRLPEEVEAADLQQLLGAKYRAHLNFVYGVRVETALQLAVLGEVHKERTATRIWENGHADDEVFARIYGRTRDELLAEFRAAAKGDCAARPEVLGGRAAAPHGAEGLSLAGLSEFTYWLFRHRIQNSDPARVASDTRKGLAHYQQLEQLRRAGGRTEQR